MMDIITDMKDPKLYFQYYLTQSQVKRLKSFLKKGVVLNEDFEEYTGYQSDNSIRIGLTNLLANEIIAKGRIDNLYYINPMFVFNGNRLTFANTYVKKQKKQIDNAKNIDLSQFHPNQIFFDFEDSNKQ